MDKPTNEKEPLTSEEQHEMHLSEILVESQHKAEPESKSVVKLKPATSNWNIGRIFWGLLFVLIGVLSLMDAFGAVDVNWSNLWRLWPLAIIAAGLSILSLKNWLGRVVAITFVIFTLFAVAVVALGGYTTVSSVDTQSVAVTKSSKDVEKAEITVKAGASKLNIGSAQQIAVTKATLESDYAKLVESSSVSGNTQQIVLSTESNKKWWIGDIRNNWMLNVNRSIPVRFIVDAGASDVDIDLAEAKLENLNLKSGASDVVIRLGSLVDNVSLKLEVGASSVVIRVPKDSGVRLELNNGLSSKSLADLSSIGDNVYESPNYSSAKSQINIDASVGVSSFTIERY